MKIFFFTKPGPSGGTFERLIVSDDGSHNTSRGGVEKDGDFFKMNAKESGLTSKGEPTTQEVAITVHDKDSYSITLHNGMTAGKPNPKIELRLHRMPTPDDYLRFFTPFMGDYTVKCKIGDNVADSTWSGRLSSTGRGFVCKGGAVLQYAAFETVDGYDPSTKKWKSSGITGTGEHGVTFLETDAASLRGKAATFQMEQTLAKPDGSTETWKGDWVFELGESGFTLVCKNLTMNGAKQPDEEYSYTPVKK